MADLYTLLSGKASKENYNLFLQLEQQAQEDPALAEFFSLYLDMLESPKSHIRVRGFRMLCAAAKWIPTDTIQQSLSRILAALEEEKPTALRQCLAALPKIIACHPLLTDRIREALNALNLSRYTNSMVPLIQKDISEILSARK